MTNTWSNEKTLDFINEVQLHPEIWNVETGMYKDNNAKKDAWSIVATKFDISSDDAYKKFRSLRTYVKNEERKKNKSGSAGGKQTKWFAYDAMSFILSQDTPKTRLDSENATENGTEAQETSSIADQEVLSETTDSLLCSVPSPKPRASKKSKTADPILEKAQNIILEAGEKRRNEFAGFAEHIANKLSKYDDYTRAQAEFNIMKILFDCDMGKYRNPASFTQSPAGDSGERASTSQSQYSEMSQYISRQNTRQPMTQEYTAPYQSPPQQYADLHHTQLTGNIAYEELVTNCQ
ncbi:unnamed protein product [Parnassius mnemosyne]|uniref:MADF domain-containing protein n=1 Tax=Parnassius mnemosyne TaxID=213953 RepID=A0AAV1M508_9NEOP